MNNYKNLIIEKEQASLCKYAMFSCNTKGRQKPISEDLFRTEFQRDRDRIRSHLYADRHIVVTIVEFVYSNYE